MEAGLGDETALAARPDRQVHVGLVATRLHRKPSERGIGSRAPASLFNDSPHILTRVLAEIGHHDGMKDDGGDARARVGKMGLEPRHGVGTVNWRRNAARDFEYLGELLETVDLIGPNEGAQGIAAFVESGINRVQIAAAALDD